MEKDINLKEVSKSFNMTVGEFALLMGYSKQALYQIFSGKQVMFTRRLYSALKLLKMQSDKIYEEDAKKIFEAKERREQYIQRMSDKVNALNVVK